MAKHQLPKLRLWVRFPSPAPRRNGLFSVPIFIDRLFTIYALQGGAFSLCCRFFFKTRSAMPLKINFCFFAKKGLTSCKRRGILIKSLRESSALINPEGFPSGQRGQTVNLLRLASMVRIHLPPPNRNGLCSVPIFLHKKSVTRAVVPPLSQKGTLGSPVRL